jgi:SAM-dependent methyltransferase
MAKRANKKPKRKTQTAASKKKATSFKLIEGKKHVLHVGCGQASRQSMPPIFHSDDWQEVRLDIAESVKPDVVGDIRNMPAVKTNTMDALFSSHNVEHVYAFEVPSVMKEFFRVLKPGGFSLVTLPDAQYIAFSIAKGGLDQPIYDSPSGPIAPLDMLYGHGASLEQGHMGMAHKTAFTAMSLARAMLNAGFHNVVVDRDLKGYALWARGVKPAPGNEAKTEHKATLKGNYPFEVITLPKEGETRDDLDAEPKRWESPNWKKAGGGQGSLF